MADQQPNGYKAIIAALLLGGVGGVGGTYSIAADYWKDTCAAQIKSAINSTRIDELNRQLGRKRGQ